MTTEAGHRAIARTDGEGGKPAPAHEEAPLRTSDWGYGVLVTGATQLCHAIAVGMQGFCYDGGRRRQYVSRAMRQGGCRKA